MNQKTLKNINICVIIVGLCLFSMWCGAVINGANATPTPSIDYGDDYPSPVLAPSVTRSGDVVTVGGVVSPPVESTPTNAATTLFDEMQQHPANVSTVQLPFVVGDTESGDNTAGD